MTTIRNARWEFVLRARRGRSRTAVAAIAAFAMLLVACGGGEEAPPEPAPEEPAATEDDAEPSEPADDWEPVTLRMATSGVTLLWTHLWIATEYGFFEEEGIIADVVETPSGVTATQALLSGDVDLSTAPLGHVIDAVSEHDRAIKAITALVNENANTLVMSTEWAEQHGIDEDSPVESKVEALRGARIGVVGPGSAVDDFIRFTLVSYGLDPDRDVELVGVGGAAAMPAALSAGEVDAFVAGSPAAETPVVRGEAIRILRGPLGDIPAMAGQLFVVAVVRQEMIDEQPEVVERVVRALYRTQQFMEANSDEVRDHLRDTRFPDIEEEVWLMAWEATQPSYSPTPVIEGAGYTVNFEILEASRGRDPAERVGFDEVVDNTFAEAAVGD
jgi:NitT/TauT family transport system substrate-binding protein